MEYLEYEHSERPNISLWAIDIIYETFRAHIDWTTNINILKSIPKLIILTYLVRFANPKSAIFATPLLNKILAILKSR